jgi:RimJ/RimL family protein N-acetyltransferase
MRTERMILRKISERDAPDLYALDSDREVRRYTDEGKPLEPWAVYEPVMLRKVEAMSVYGAELGFWAARFHDGTFLGWFHFRPNRSLFPEEMEIGYRLRRQFWGGGLATEGVGRLLQHGWGLGIGYAMGVTLAANVGSRRVMEKSGMSLERSFVYPETLAPYWSEAERAAVKYSVVLGRTGAGDFTAGA